MADGPGHGYTPQMTYRLVLVPLLLLSACSDSGRSPSGAPVDSGADLAVDAAPEVSLETAPAPDTSRLEVADAAGADVVEVSDAAADTWPADGRWAPPITPRPCAILFTREDFDHPDAGLVCKTIPKTAGCGGTLCGGQTLEGHQVGSGRPNVDLTWRYKANPGNTTVRVNYFNPVAPAEPVPGADTEVPVVSTDRTATSVPLSTPCYEGLVKRWYGACVAAADAYDQVQVWW